MTSREVGGRGNDIFKQMRCSSRNILKMYIPVRLSQHVPYPLRQWHYSNHSPNQYK